MNISLAHPTSNQQRQALGVVTFAIVHGLACSIVYVKPSGVVNIREIKPTSVEPCQNGNYIVRARDPHAEGAWKSFSASGIVGAWSDAHSSATVVTP